MHALPSIGAIIDETYEIKSLLGKGGFGAVYLARHIPMEREVALKLLIASGHNPQEMIQRFRREVMAIRNLSHPNTIRIFDYRDSTEDTLIYYTMEYLKGATLKDLVRSEGPQAPRRIKHILKQILKSLAEAHSFGIIHRDLKPANIMLVEMYGEHDFVKVLDFGIAKVMENEDDEDEPLTSAGMLVGTLRYMSPEQIKGEPLGPYTDIYALGLIVLEMVIGQSVFAGTGRWEILQQQVSPTPIEFPAEFQHSPLAPVLRKMLDKERLQRYPNAEALLRDLNSIPDNALSDRPLIHRPNTSQGRAYNSNSSRSMLSGGPSTPPPMPADEVPTTISSISELSQSQQRVRAPHQGGFAPPMPASAVEGAPPLPTAPSHGAHTSPSQPAFHTQNAFHTSSVSLSSDTSPPFGDSEQFVPPALARGGKKPLIIAVGALAALFLLGIGAYLALGSSDNEVPTEEDLSATTVSTLEGEEQAQKGAAESGDQQEAALSEGKEEQEPQEKEEPPLIVKLALASGNAAKQKAHAFLGDRDLGSLPLEYALPHDAPQAELTIRAEGYKDYPLTIDHSSGTTVEIALEKVPVKKATVKTSRTNTSSKNTDRNKTKPRQNKAKPSDDEWAPIEIKKKPDVPIFE